MAANLTARFKMVDEMSSRLEKISGAGQAALEQWERAGSAIKVAFDGASAETEKTARVLDGTSDSLDDYSDALEKARKSSEGLGEETEDTGDKTKEYGDKTKKAKDQTVEFANALAAAGVAKLLQEIGAAALECVDAFQIYETSVAKMSTLADTSVLSLEEMSGQVIALSNNTGQAASDVANAAYEAMSAGVDTANAVDFAGQANELAVGGFTSVTTAVDVLTTALNAYGLETENASQIADYLVTTQNLGKTTVDQLASSVGKVIPIAAAYGVEMDNLSTAMAIMTSNGIATAETVTSLKAMLNELGDSASVVSSTLVEETGYNFAQLTEQGYSLGDVLQVLGDSVNGNTGKFNELWGSVEAGIGALSLMGSGAEKYNAVLDDMQNSAGATAKAFETMTDTSAFTEQRMKNSAENLKIAIGESLAPAIDKVNGFLASMFEWMTGIADRHPGVVKAVTGIAVGVGVFVAALTGYVVVSKLAKAATDALTASMAANPFLLAGAAIVGVVAGLASLALTADDANDASEQLTATSQKQADELENLNAEYEQVCETYGETSYEAWALKEEIDELSAAYENNKQTLEEHWAEIDELSESLQKSREEYEATCESLENERDSSIALIEKLQELGSESTLAARNQALIIPIIDELNKRYEGLGLTFDSLTGRFNMTFDEMRKIALDEYNNKAFEEGWKNYVNAVGQLEITTPLHTEAKKTLDELAKEKDEALKALTDYMASAEYTTHFYSGTYDFKLEELANAQTATYKAWDSQNTAFKTIDKEYNALSSTVTDFEEKYGTSMDEMEDSTIDYEAVFTSSFQSVEEGVSSLVKAYDEVYTSARDSIDGQIGLFDEMVVEAEMSIEEMQGALASQYDYLNTYNENLKKALGYGFDKDLILSLSDGSVESAAYLDTLISKAEEIALTASPEAAAAFVEDFNKQFQDVEGAKDTMATTVAGMQVDLEKGLDDIYDKIAEGVDNLELGEEAGQAAKDTIQAYIDNLKLYGSDAILEAKSIGQQVASALMLEYNAGNGALSDAQMASYDVNGDGKVDSLDAAQVLRQGAGALYNFTGYADGTDYATPGWHLVGEEGPELMRFDGGEKVYPAGETSRILAGGANSDGGTKTIRLDINGSGAINVDMSMSEEAVVELLYTHIKPVLMNVVQSEIYEEGDGSYEY